MNGNFWHSILFSCAFWINKANLNSKLFLKVGRQPWSLITQCGHEHVEDCQSF